MKLTSAVLRDHLDVEVGVGTGISHGGNTWGSGSSRSTSTIGCSWSGSSRGGIDGDNGR